jgi:hypothetical protein
MADLTPNPSSISYSDAALFGSQRIPQVHAFKIVC